ncbi:hypothetical protein H5410_005099, partial [Solanum commersonii]
MEIYLLKGSMKQLIHNKIEDNKVYENVSKNMAPTIVKCFTWLVIRKASFTRGFEEKEESLCPDVNFTQNGPCLSTLQICWIRIGGTNSQQRWCKIIPHCIWWTVWRERNNRCFEDESNFIHKVKCIVSFSFWCKETDIEELERVSSISLMLSQELSCLEDASCRDEDVEGMCGNSKSDKVRNDDIPNKRRCIDGPMRECERFAIEGTRRDRGRPKKCRGERRQDMTQFQ